MVIVSHFRDIYTKQPCTSRKLSNYPDSVSSLNTEQGNLLNEILWEKKVEEDEYLEKEVRLEDLNLSQFSDERVDSELKEESIEDFLRSMSESNTFTFDKSLFSAENSILGESWRSDTTLESGTVEGFVELLDIY